MSYKQKYRATYMYIITILQKYACIKKSCS